MDSAYHLVKDKHACLRCPRHITQPLLLIFTRKAPAASFAATRRNPWTAIEVEGKRFNAVLLLFIPPPKHHSHHPSSAIHHLRHSISARTRRSLFALPNRSRWPRDLRLFISAVGYLDWAWNRLSRFFCDRTSRDARHRPVAWLHRVSIQRHLWPVFARGYHSNRQSTSAPSALPSSRQTRGNEAVLRWSDGLVSAQSRSSRGVNRMPVSLCHHLLCSALEVALRGALVQRSDCRQEIPFSDKGNRPPRPIGAATL